ncbi:hypothetical protein [Cryobacterium melibiosiphilum]|uniref:hypothetical protein n=1 Tax=Cryobacterium melibiosiphilum TaxID=995039 RepID=UPI0013144581|nr:hypothetical protein [Cryobacterium melibiosiphilum]
MHVVSFFFAMVVFVLGMWLFGLAFEVTSLHLPIFFSGIVCVGLALAIPVHILRK